MWVKGKVNKEREKESERENEREKWERCGWMISFFNLTIKGILRFFEK